MSVRLRSFLAVAFSATFLAAATSVQATTTSVATPGNVLAGATAFASSEILAGFPAAHTVDNLVRATPPSDQDHGLIFSNSDADQRLGLSGTFGAIEELRIWTIPVTFDARIPNSVTVRSSTNSLAGAALINTANYETLIGNFPLGVAAFTGTWPMTDNTYATVSLNAPAGTQSLLLSFGNVADAKGERISEVQAFVGVPEPTSLALAGVMAMLSAAFWRRR